MGGSREKQAEEVDLSNRGSRLDRPEDMRMNREETKQMLKILSVAYPRTYAGYSEQQKTETVDLYFALFGKCETEIVVSALCNYVKSNQYPPTPAGIQAQIDLILSTDDSAIELWNTLAKAVRNGYYGYEEEYNKLPEVCQKWLHCPEQLKELAVVDFSTLNSVIRGQFLKTIGEIQKKEKANSWIQIANQERERLESQDSGV